MMKVEPDPMTGCWEWRGYRRKTNYGEFNYGGKKYLAHRFSFEAHVGPIPEDLVIDHLCRNPGCVNPRHMELVTRRVNTLRGLKGRMPSTCKHGHAWTAENTYWRKTTPPRRSCRTCHREASRSAYVPVAA